MKFNYIFYDSRKIKIKHSDHYECLLHSKLETYLIKLLYNYHYVRTWASHSGDFGVWFDTLGNLSPEFTGLELLLRMQAELRQVE